jgi:hypothetical protein
VSPISDELAALRHSVTLVAHTDVPQLRCWRCLQRFPADATRVSTATPKRWLRNPCDRKLGPSDRSA